MKREGLLSVAEARERILAGAAPFHPAESVGLTQALHRILASDLSANLTQPPCAVSAMDGYAVRSADLASLPARLKLVGESAAGHGFDGRVGPLETVRIFTGAPVPDGADAILMQEYASAEDADVAPLRTVARGQFVRARGLDFTKGEVLLRAGTRLGPSQIALAAAMNHPKIPVTRRPRVAILATGDELEPPGTELSSRQIIACNSFAVAAIVATAGGEPIDLGIARDEAGAVEAGIRAARDAGADVLVTLGGASVGDHDLVKKALASEGMALDFWRVAMRPGKPLIHGRLGSMAILGLPGNPVSAIITSMLFLAPLVRALAGDAKARIGQCEPAVLGAFVRANDSREDYLRGSLAVSADALPVATPFEAQDSSLMGLLGRADCLIIRPPFALEAAAGEHCQILRAP
ncbi:gephyrin-like molybdotransferase Glp [Methylocapsa palsarum]|uniref:Molybdopterin molybdenumtransferase n=1 Tax=Methylocapsa palsarum TaxID=1612308 RepID=A0A1I3Y9H4_9HYPH|nr:gephyrin-like molybdotransferase Glp [Methylocapsa palsarum]SFK27856.1 molybdopterin molybdotransferase [Methylocapsa palsarum]